MSSHIPDFEDREKFLVRIIINLNDTYVCHILRRKKLAKMKKMSLVYSNLGFRCPTWETRRTMIKMRYDLNAMHMHCKRAMS